MADVRDWGRFVRGRWDWSRFGYEAGFPRGCQFTDVDAAVEFDGQRLVIEAKAFDGEGPLSLPPVGQLRFLRDEAACGKSVLVLYGCAVCNDPYAVYNVGTGRWYIWQDDDGFWLPRTVRRGKLKDQIDFALGLIDEERAGLGSYMLTVA